MRALHLRACLGVDPLSRKCYVAAGDINPATGKQYAVNPSSGVWDDNYFAANFGGGGGKSGGGGTPRLDFAKSMVNDYTASDKVYADKQSTARTALLDFYSGLQSPVDRFNTISEQQGVPQQQALVDELTKGVLGTTKQLNAIPDSVKTRAGDFFINDADKTAIINHESAPVQKALASLISGKQDAEVGLDAKKQLVSTLLNLSMQGDEMKARPLQLGVDYTTADRNAARQLFMDVMGVTVPAFNADQDSADADRRAAEDRAFQKSMQDATFGQQVNMENLSSKNQLANSLAMAKFEVDNRRPTGGGTVAAPNSNPIYKGKTKEQVADIAQKTEDTWNNIIGRSKTEADVWKQIADNGPKLQAAGVDLQTLWSKHAALMANVGSGGSIRKSEGKTYTIDGKTYTVPS